VVVILDAMAMALVLSDRGVNTVAQLQLVCAGAGLLVLYLVRQGALDWAAQTFCVLCYGFALATALFVDLPIPSVPRVTHAYMLPLYLAAHLLWPRSQRWSRAGFLVLCLVSFVVLAVVPNPLGIRPLMTDEERYLPGAVASAFVALGTWITLRLHLMELRERSALELDLARAIASEALDVHLQPQCDATGRTLAAEALVRWRHPVQGPISPASFIPLAESAGLIVPLGQLVMNRCCETLRAWRDDPVLGGLCIAVNVSALQVANDEAFAALLAPVRADPSLRGRLKLELTESAVTDDTARLQRMLAACRDAGVLTSLDDFGTGYSALSYLNELAFDQLKIDQSFVRQMCTQDRSRKVVETIVRLGKDLDMELIAEGVETEAQRTALEALGCHRFQGYLFSKPVPVPAFEAQVRAQAATPA
jgi:EAL domain-containing protein (putative c-di-GMP-specific phosphodiesterase class I)